MYGTTTRSYISGVSLTMNLGCEEYFLICTSVAGQMTVSFKSGRSIVSFRNP
jgi:hypothetical protein